MESILFYAVIVLGVAVSCDSCVNPKITSKSITTLDATILTNVAYVSEFSVDCVSGSLANLYADIDGNLQPVSLIGTNKFQVSWTEEISTARNGERIIRIFDEDNYTDLRKVLRDGEGGDSIVPLFSVSLHHPGAFTGPWLKSEFLATTISILVAYLAFSSRSKLLS